MDTAALPLPPVLPGRHRLIAGGALMVMLLLAIAFGRRLAAAGPAGLAIHHVWLAIHLLTVIPAVPLGAVVLLSRKGGVRHRLTGRIWATLMMSAAASSFGIRTSGQLSWIHILSAVVLVSIPRAVFAARQGRIAAHMRGMTMTYLGLIGAGLFVFLPARLLGGWLLG